MMSVQGPLARRVRDLRLGLAAMAQFDPRDPWWVPAPLQGLPFKRPIRVAVSADPGGLGVAPAVAAAIRQAAGWLAEAGYVVEEKEPPDFMAAVDAWRTILGTETRIGMLPMIEKYGDKAVRHMARYFDKLTPSLNLPSFGKALASRSTLLRAWMLFFEDFPLVLVPVSCEPPFPAGHDQGDDDTLDRLVTAQRAQFPAACLGLPGISVPTGIADGLPMGVQLIAGRFREDLLLDAAEIIEARAPMPTPLDPRP
jgi:amidase